jgi:hypothetical protein
VRPSAFNLSDDSELEKREAQKSSMGQKLRNDRYRKFAQEIAAGTDPRQAYVIAGYELIGPTAIGCCSEPA